MTVADVLDTVPVRNTSVREERRNEGETVLVVPLKRRWYMGPPLSWVMPFSGERKVELDPLGMDVWGWCDGQRTAEDVIDAFAEKHHVTFHEARVSVLTFLRELTRRGLIVMLGDGEGAKG